MQTAAAGDSSDEENLPVRKGLNSLFAGGDSTAQESKQVFEDKVSKTKKQSENRRLTSGAHHLVRPKEMDQVPKDPKSKGIKKKFQKHEITREQVQAKLKSRRLAIPASKLRR